MGMYSRIQGPLSKPSGPTKTVAQAMIKRPTATPKAANDLPDLEACEQVMVRGFQDVARAIARIREARLYTEAGYATFDDYCEQRMGLSRKRGDQLASAHFTIQSLPKRLATIVGNEAKARAITAIPEERRVEVLTRVARTGHVTAKAIREAAQPPVIDVEPMNPPSAETTGDTLRPEHLDRMKQLVTESRAPQPMDVNPMLMPPDPFGPKLKPCPTCGGCGTVEDE